MNNRTLTYYSSADASAPTLTGQVDSLRQLLKAILVDGYGSKAAAGWTQQFSGTNKAVFKMASGGTNCVIRVLDDGTQTGAAREALVRAGESASDVDTLVDPFPLTTQVANADCNWRKSNTTDSTARVWKAIADGRFFALWIEATASGQGDLMYFGDIESFYSSDPYACVMTTRNANNSGGTMLSLGVTNRFGDAVSSGPRTVFMRNVSGSVKAEGAGIVTATTQGVFGQPVQSAGFADYPHPITAKLHMRMTLMVAQGGQLISTGDNTLLRGLLPGVFEFLHGEGISSLAHNDTFTDSAYDASSSFVIVGPNATLTASAVHRVIFQIAGTWKPHG